ncbi:type II secretion system F family protein [Aeromicrobium sp.]|uniref:type II secretion system F family protein n=1 Tax=Aeromicrobium sp. TaxID=1871063 RepID=UPI003D6BB48B
MTWLAFAAAAATSMSLLLARPSAAWILRVRLGARTTRRRRRPKVGPAARVGLVAAFVVVAVASSRPSLVIIAATALGSALFVLRQVRLSRNRAVAVRTRAQTVAALDLLSAELRAGILPGHALAALADDVPSLRPAAVAASQGGDVVAALRAASAQPGAGALSDLAGAWHVGERAGAPLAAVLDRVTQTVRDDAEVDRDVQAEAAPARATGRLMAVLPLLGLSLGAGMGADPVHVITQTVVGAACLAGGLALACVGILWVDRIVTGVERA